MSKELKPIDSIRGSLEAMKPQFKTALPKHITVDKFNRVLMTAISSTKDLQDADRTSLFASCMKLAQQGLLPDGKEAAIVTFKDNKRGIRVAQAMPMISGILKLVRNSGELAALSPHTVCKNDQFDYWIDETGEHLQHRPCLEGERGDITHAYCIAKTKDGAAYIEVMSKDELDKVRASSRTGKYGPWADWYGEMAKKTVIRRLAKRLPMSTDLDEAIVSDDDLYDVSPTPPPAADTPEEPKEVKKAAKKKSKKLADAVKTHVDDEESPAALTIDHEPAADSEPPPPTEEDLPI